MIQTIKILLYKNILIIIISSKKSICYLLFNIYLDSNFNLNPDFFKDYDIYLFIHQDKMNLIV